jgi:hypothetical protein
MAVLRACCTVAARVTLIAACLAPSACGGGTPHSNGFSTPDDAAAPDASGAASDGAAGPDAPGDSTVTVGAHDSGSAFGEGGGTGPDATAGLDVEPSTLQTITVSAGQSTPTVLYKATLNGVAANVGWGIDRGNVGTIGAGPASSATFTPTGTTGGLVTLVASTGSQSVHRQVFVKLAVPQQNGANPGSALEQGQIALNVPQLSAGGGIGGVGGEGLGGPVMDPTTLGALQAPASSGQGQGLSFLYPYDKTVWPRGMLAPLLMWTWNAGAVDAIQIRLATTSGSFSWTGTFARPLILSQTMRGFVRHPIPQDVWNMATDTAGAPTPGGTADQLTMSLTVATGGQGYGPIQQTWTVAPGRLTGTVYYNSYATQLVKNWATRDGAGNTVGAAILGIRSGDTAPTLVVGQNSSDDSGCRVCHIVSSRGKWLIAQSEQSGNTDYQSYLYDLTQPNVQGSSVMIPQTGVFAWAAMVGDGSYALTNTLNPSSSNPAINNSSNGTAVSSFWQFGPSPAMGSVTGLPSGVAAGYPSYSPDDKYVAYVDATGKTQDVQGPLVMAAYNATGHAFSSVRTLHAPMPGQRIGYPVFLPDDSGILFETQVRTAKGGNSDGVSDTVLVTRNGARSQLWWTTTGSTPTPVTLGNLNGNAYLPLGPNNHGVAGTSDPESPYDETGYDDTTLNYEPAVLPVAAGGYAWVVFTSRRMYGNQLTSVPWLSWPPDYNTTDLAQATVKKLWVAAIDLNAPPGTDPSHPAFYLPAQEILAGNSRGFWVLDPCRADGQSCLSGDQCCNGYCEPSVDGGALVCGNTPPVGCSGVSDKCTTATDCCDSTNRCINGYCSPQVSQ